MGSGGQGVGQGPRVKGSRGWAAWVPGGQGLCLEGHRGSGGRQTGSQGSRGGPTGSQRVKEYAYRVRVPGGQRVGLQGPRLEVVQEVFVDLKIMRQMC